MTDANGVTVSNGYADNNAPYDVATATVAGKRFQKVIPCDASGTPTSAEGVVAGALAIAYQVIVNRPVGATSTTTRIDTGGVDFTATVRAGDFLKIVSGGTLALSNIAREISAVTPTYIDLETALPATPAPGVDLWDVLRATNAATSGDRISISLGEALATVAVSHVGLTAIYNAIGVPFLASPGSAIQIAGEDPDGFDGPELRVPNVVSRTPGAAEYGIIARTIPSGTQEIAPVIPTTGSTPTAIALNTATLTLVLAANASRKYAYIYNPGIYEIGLRLSTNTTSPTVNSIRIPAQTSWASDLYEWQGPIYAISYTTSFSCHASEQT